MTEPDTDIPLSLELRCRDSAWMHDRATVRIPIGPSGFENMRESVDTPVAKLTASLLLHHGVQPLVLKMPPLAKLILRGCGCQKCNRCATTDPDTKRSWIVAPQLLCLYASALQTRAFTPKRKGSSISCVKYINAFTREIRRVVLSELQHQSSAPEDSQLSRAWKLIWSVLGNADATDAERVSVLLPMATEYAEQPGLTLQMIHIMEHIVWGVICKHSPQFKNSNKSKDDVFGVLEEVPWLLVQCPPHNIMKMTEWQHDSEICSEVNAWTVEHARELRTLMCGEPTGTVLKQWPSIRVPSHDAIPTDTTGDEQLVPLASAVYTTLSMVYIQLHATRAPESMPLVDDALPAGKDDSVPEVAAD